MVLSKEKIMEVNKLIDSLIPPNDYQHRNGFTNTHIIDRLTSLEKSLIEDALIVKLLNEREDLLIVETLAYLHSEKSLLILYSLLKGTNNASAKLIIAASIFFINKDEKMIDIAVTAFKSLEKIKDAYSVYRLLPMFYYLSTFKNKTTDSIIREYAQHDNYLLSYNAKQFLRK